MCIRDRFIALKDHYDKLVEEADQNFVASSNKMQSLLNGEEAVSYTHLDVYKRQALRLLMTEV